MKRKAFLKHLRKYGCDLLREGGSHSWWYHMESGKKSSVPRHSEIDDMLTRKICKDLGIDWIR
ncbi:YcfA family protein [Desulfamplus magnetovallimortis]|uniref:YcfA family protein n=1 Tax=Desulfamplus magnetovallimortis TaxID=1246637 RepID=A0A1W1HL33_9BACT|nr:type II toxin-antitoxin system HicA family toxin [Desulfamplus magnetovallimortis]SLM33184.1 YcfA family protein [Desulfamplus magnetovallimortis]